MGLETRVCRREPIETEVHPPSHEVEQVLDQILESPPFRTSNQCKNLLRYVVEHSLRGDDAALRERVIGSEVFGRDPAYDTNDDPVVRMRASDVRKRLAQFYQSLGTDVVSEWHIELQPGSYRAHFRYDERVSSRPTEAGPATEAVVLPAMATSVIANPQELSGSATVAQVSAGVRRIPWYISISVVSALLVLLAVAGARRFTAQTPEERFWTPLLSSKQPVLIYLGTNVVYIFSNDFLDSYRTAHGLPNTGQEFVPDLPANSTVAVGSIVPVLDTFVATGDVTAVVQMTSQLYDWNKPFVLRQGRDIAMGDLRGRPSIMVGGFNNRWSIDLTRNLPFSFREGTRIQERDRPFRAWSVPVTSNQANTDDYAMITRELSSQTGGPSLVVAGIGQYGTQAAAEFITNPESMRELLSKAPPGWEKMNMQAVLHVKVIDYQPVAVEVAATSYW